MSYVRVHLTEEGTMLLSIPDESLLPGTRYELEVLALEVSGNQTLTSAFFVTG